MLVHECKAFERIELQPYTPYKVVIEHLNTSKSPNHILTLISYFLLFLIISIKYLRISKFYFKKKKSLKFYCKKNGKRNLIKFISQILDEHKIFLTQETKFI